MLSGDEHISLDYTHEKSFAGLAIINLFNIEYALLNLISNHKKINKYDVMINPNDNLIFIQ